MIFKIILIACFIFFSESILFLFKILQKFEPGAKSR